jgi:protein SCO1/2
VRRWLWILVLVVSVGTSTDALAHELSPDQISGVGVTQHLGDALPLDARFVDEDGSAVTLADYFNTSKPVILSLNYFHCQYVCPIEEDGLIAALNGITSMTLGPDYSLLTVSIDPKDGPSDGYAVKARELRGYDRAEGARGWHLLTGDSDSIQRLTDALGFQYVPDPEEGDFAHPIGVVVLTPDGRVSRYVHGLDFASNDMRAALQDATGSSVADVFQGVLVVCYQYDPLTGRNTQLALNLVRIGGGVGLAAVVVWLAMLWRADLRGRAA